MPEGSGAVSHEEATITSVTRNGSTLTATSIGAAGRGASTHGVVSHEEAPGGRAPRAWAEDIVEVLVHLFRTVVRHHSSPREVSARGFCSAVSTFRSVERARS